MAHDPVLSSSSLIGDSVVNLENESLGTLKEIMIDTETGRIAYAVLSFGGVLGVGEKLFAVPWSSIEVDAANKRLLMNVDKERLRSAPGFDKNNWPAMSDRAWGEEVYSYYGATPYWR